MKITPKAIEALELATELGGSITASQFAAHKNNGRVTSGVTSSANGQLSKYATAGMFRKENVNKTNATRFHVTKLGALCVRAYYKNQR